MINFHQPIIEESPYYLAHKIKGLYDYNGKTFEYNYMFYMDRFSPSEIIDILLRDRNIKEKGLTYCDKGTRVDFEEYLYSVT